MCPTGFGRTKIIGTVTQELYLFWSLEGRSEHAEPDESGGASLQVNDGSAAFRLWQRDIYIGIMCYCEGINSEVDRWFILFSWGFNHPRWCRIFFHPKYATLRHKHSNIINVGRHVYFLFSLICLPEMMPPGYTNLWGDS